VAALALAEYLDRAALAAPTVSTAIGLPSQDYWYWQVGLVARGFGLEWTAAYTDTSIEPSGCGNTAYCSGRVFTSITKTF
jgi:hypothetical protein